MSQYASNTSVSVEKSKAEIEKCLQKYGASRFMSGWDQDQACIAFEFKGRLIRIVLPLPDKSKFSMTPAKRNRRSPEQQYAAWEQACRQRWRALSLVIKAKLEAVESEIATFEDEFLAYTCLPSGETISDYLQPKISTMLETGKMPKLMLPGETS